MAHKHSSNSSRVISIPKQVCCTGVMLLERVEGLVSLGARALLGVHMTEWHGRLIVAAIDVSKIVILYAITPLTYKVGSAA